MVDCELCTPDATPSSCGRDRQRTWRKHFFGINKWEPVSRAPVIVIVFGGSTIEGPDFSLGSCTSE